MSIYLNSANVASGAAGQEPEKHLAQEPSTCEGIRMPGIPPFLGLLTFPYHSWLPAMGESVGLIE